MCMSIWPTHASNNTYDIVHIWTHLLLNLGIPGQLGDGE